MALSDLRFRQWIITGMGLERRVGDPSGTAMFRPEMMPAWTRVANAEASGNCLKEDSGPSRKSGCGKRKIKGNV